ncbi:MAG: glycosyltransferase family 87 protein [Anaerolineae bacterium]|nr:DUF2029 domain-containing protein [Anaerolineae bacterium]MDW8067659.1 glycosyltransferase family 87 protein [Anaerolineae bacterium]
MTRWLTPRRLSYAWLAGGALWLAWLVSVLLGPGNLDLAGQPVGTDFLEFYAAGATLLRGESARLYDMDYQARLQREIIGPGLEAYYAFITPPFFALLFVPLALLPYGLAFALWSFLGLVALWASVRLMGIRSSRPFLWALTWFPVFAAVSYGQNSLLSLFLLALTFRLWRDGRPWAAGLALAGLMYKPQLTLGLALLWLVSGRDGWKALGGWALGTVALTALCAVAWPEASQAYLHFARTILPDLPNWQDFPLWHLHTVRGFWRLLLPESPLLGDVLTLLLTGLGLVEGYRFWRCHRLHPPLTFAAAVALTLWITPHAMIYDWAILLIPAVLLWEEVPERRREWRALYALVWLTTFLAPPLTYGQWRLAHRAVQITLLALSLALYRIRQSLNRPPILAISAKMGYDMIDKLHRGTRPDHQPDDRHEPVPPGNGSEPEQPGCPGIPSG